MKKAYVRPEVLCEEFSPETALCGCGKISPTPSLAAQCGFVIPEINVAIFVEGWSSCTFKTGSGNQQYCVQPGVIQIFDS